ncbi:hypothetical protein HELRODRAFT_185906 [Helobdella robusta]|uniref:BAG family molecular chaperone regulator 1 n=1 Tax=Helobdella robusta TaxID=6412 RepID=T1FNF3_HELRO|nr:hypothetical protein HELRODRAFT_185906 [Helobdella robusta]ESN97519.1 hypothetical protein HELRODRAFT_185906 [Helobdella robusta]
MSEAGLNIIVNHGHDRHSIFLPNDNSTLEDLANSIEVVTGVPPINQKIIFKGRSLTLSDEMLSSVGIFNNSKIMIIGKKYCEDDEKHLNVMKAVDKKFQQMNEKFNEVAKQFQDLQNGFVGEDLHKELKQQLVKQLMVTSQQLMTSLEQLDSLMLAGSASEVQSFRKKTVNQINSLLTKIDSLQESVEKFS